MRHALALLVAVLAACTPAVRPAAPPAPSPASTLQAAFGIEGRPVSCRAIDLYVGDHTATRFLRLRVDRAALGLRAGRHEIDLATAGAAVSLEVVVFASPNPELPDCSDVARAQPPVRERWTATAGHLALGFSRDVPEGQNFDATVALRGVEFHGPSGARRTVDANLGSVTAGWLPG
jgi:hypothetical protein